MPSLVFIRQELEALAAGWVRPETREKAHAKLEEMMRPPELIKGQTEIEEMIESA